MRLVPLTERGGVDLDDGGFGKRVRADEFVVRRMEGHADDADFACYAFGAPGEVAGFESEGTVFGVTTTGADEMDTLGADTGVGWLATLLKSSVFPKVRLVSTSRFESRTSSCDSMLALLR